MPVLIPQLPPPFLTGVSLDIALEKGDLLDPGIKSKSPALQADSLLSEAPGKPKQAKITLARNLQAAPANLHLPAPTRHQGQTLRQQISVMQAEI